MDIKRWWNRQADLEEGRGYPTNGELVIALVLFLLLGIAWCTTFIIH